jgi:hypothetical protein
MPRFPPRGPHGRLFPRFAGTIKALRLPAILPVALRCLRSTVPRDHAYFAPSAAACRRGGPGVVRPVTPSGKSSVEKAGSPKFLGNPDFRLLMFFDPGRQKRLRPITRCDTVPARTTTRTPTMTTISGLNSMAFGLAVYVSRCRLPFTAQDSLPGAGQALLGGLLPVGFLQKVSNHFMRLSSFSKLLGTTFFCGYRMSQAEKGSGQGRGRRSTANNDRSTTNRKSGVRQRDRGLGSRLGLSFGHG